MEAKVVITLTPSEAENLKIALRKTRHYLREHVMKNVVNDDERNFIGGLHNDLKEFSDNF